MNHKQKHTNLPMIVMKELQHGGWYEYGKYYIDMDVPYPHFLSKFTVPGGKIFVQLLNGWILCAVRRTVSGILPFADPDGRHAHDAFHRFFPDARWRMAGL